MVVLERKTRSGRRVYLDHGGIETDPEWSWTTVCEDHGHLVSHRTRRTAMIHLSHPEEWCEVCMGNKEAL